MGHYIFAFFGDPHLLPFLAGDDRFAHVFPLAPNVAALPVIWKWLNEACPPDGGLCADGPFVRLTRALEARAIAASRRGPLAYVETDYAGGVGYQRAVVWNKGAVAIAAEERVGIVNRALAELGVKRAGGRDEWDTLGLAGYRDNESFFAKAGVPFDGDDLLEPEQA